MVVWPLVGEIIGGVNTPSQNKITLYHNSTALSKLVRKNLSSMGNTIANSKTSILDQCPETHNDIAESISFDIVLAALIIIAISIYK